jgi:hypothetical protein
MPMPADLLVGLFEMLKLIPVTIFLSLRDHGILLKVLSVVALVLPLISCSRGRTEQLAPPQAVMSGDVAPGAILVDILKSGHPENYWQYEVRPTTGVVRKVKEETFPDYAHENLPHVFLQPAGAIGACSSDTKAASPDGKYLAYCTPSESGLFIADKKSAAPLYFWKWQS